MREVGSIAFVRELQSVGQSVVEGSISALALVLEVRDVGANPPPPDTRDLHIFLGVHGDAHALVVERIRFH